MICEIYYDEAEEWIRDNSPKLSKEEIQQKKDDYYIWCCINGHRLPE